MSSIISRNYVRRTGDNMSGNLTIDVGKTIDGFDLSVKIAQIQSDLTAHAALTNNPHTVTKTQVGLGSVYNKEQVAKDGTVSMSGNLNMGNQQIVTGGNVDGVDVSVLKSGHDSHLANSSNPHSVTKSQVGLSLVVNKIQVAKDGSIAMTGSLAMGGGLTVDGVDVSGLPASINLKYNKTGGQLTGNITFSGGQTVDGRDVSSLPTIQQRTKTGTYTGNAVDNRNIDIGVNLAAKNNVYIRLCGVAAASVYWIDWGQNDLSMWYNWADDSANQIQALTSTGFQVGDGMECNGNGDLIRYIVSWEEP